MSVDSDAISSSSAPMLSIYLDYNVIASAVGIPPQPDALTEMNAIWSLRRRAAQFVLSAWTAYELARSEIPAHVAQCCAFVEALRPMWVSDARHLVDREIALFLARHTGAGLPRPVRALNETIGHMWSTYGIHVADGERFTDCVSALRADPRNLQTILHAAGSTSRAIVAIRSARAQDHIDAIQLDREYFAERLACRSRDTRVDILIAHRPLLYKESPTLAIEDALMQLRAKDSFAPNSSHAADLQHAMASLGYCDHFVTRDGQLRSHANTVVRRLGLSCQVHARVAQITAI